MDLLKGSVKLCEASRCKKGNSKSVLGYLWSLGAPFGRGVWFVTLCKLAETGLSGEHGCVVLLVRATQCAGRWVRSIRIWIIRIPE